jgi:hypothetical protein
MIHSCEDIREHLEACEECRLHVVVEARLRTEPVLEPPQGLVDRAMRALPRTVPVRREFFRLAAAAVLLIGLAIAAVSAGLDQSAPVVSVREHTAQAIEATTEMWNAWRTQTW